MIPSHFPEKIREIRRFLQLTQQDMASHLNISAKACSKIECGKTRIHLNRLERISEAFRLEPVQLIGYSTEVLLQMLLQQEKKG